MDQKRKIHEILFVADRIITYKVAAAILNVEVNEAKLLLQQYIKDKNNGNFNVSYVIGGITKDKEHKICIVSEKKYHEVKKKYSKITIDHIYSIQKAPLVDWVPVFNVDDFLYNKTESEIKEEKVVEIKKEVPSPSKTKAKVATNKKDISNFFSSNQKTTENASKKTSANNKKPAKNNPLVNFMTKNNTTNKENSTKDINSLKVTKEEIKTETEDKDSDDEEIAVKRNKKRTRVINDDDDEQEYDTPNKCPKVDILDDPMECNDENASDEDIFGSPERDDEEESPQINTEETIKTESTDVTEKETENSTQSSDTYQDDEGFFVTEKKPGAKRLSQNKKQEKVETKKEIAEKKKRDKEINQKLKKNTNQNTLFTYFKKQ